MKYHIYIRTGRPKRKKGPIKEGLEKEYIMDGPLERFEVEGKTSRAYWVEVIRVLIKEKRPKFINGGFYYLRFYKHEPHGARIKELGRIFV